jgi:uracil-DNA glycosylase
MGVTPDEFYDESRVAIVPMGFCFPGLDANGSDLPPRKECAPLWRDPVLKALPHLELVLLVGSYAQRWHLPEAKRVTIGQTVAQWRAISNAERRPVFVPLPHPSWRNNAWVKRHPWFEAELLPFVRSEVRRLLAAGPAATSG